MAKRMSEIIREYPKKKPMKAANLGLPYLESVHVALNVAACDSQRLLIVYARSAAERKRLESLLLPLAWSEDLVGNLLYATTTDAQDLANIAGSTQAPGLLVVEPDPYGLEARQVAFVKLGTKPAEALDLLVAAAEGNEMGSKDSKRHIGRGRRQGLKWEQPVEDR